MIDDGSETATTTARLSPGCSGLDPLTNTRSAINQCDTMTARQSTPEQADSQLRDNAKQPPPCPTDPPWRYHHRHPPASYDNVTGGVGAAGRYLYHQYCHHHFASSVVPASHHHHHHHHLHPPFLHTGAMPPPYVPYATLPPSAAPPGYPPLALGYQMAPYYPYPP